MFVLITSLMKIYTVLNKRNKCIGKYVLVVQLTVRESNPDWPDYFEQPVKV